MSEALPMRSGERLRRIGGCKKRTRCHLKAAGFLLQNFCFRQSVPAAAQQAQQVQEQIDKIQIQFQCADNRSFLEHFRLIL